MVIHESIWFPLTPSAMKMADSIQLALVKTHLAIRGGNYICCVLMQLIIIILSQGQKSDSLHAVIILSLDQSQGNCN